MRFKAVVFFTADKWEELKIALPKKLNAEVITMEALNETE